MNGFIERLLAPMRRGPRTTTMMVAPSERDPREIARALGHAIDRAMNLGLWDHAERLAGSAAKLARQHPQLTERLARLKLAQGDAETALRIVESCAWQSASLRFLRAACLVSLGRKHEAHADLQQWSGRATAPLGARHLLALLEWRGGDDRAAIASLQRNLKQIDDRATLFTLALIGAVQRRDAWAKQWSDRLHAMDSSDAFGRLIDLALTTIGLQKPAAAPGLHTHRRIAALAAELVANEHVIPALVEAQRLQPDAPTIALLVSSIERALPQLENVASADSALKLLRRLELDPHASIELKIGDGLDAPSDVLATIGTQQSAVRERAA